MQIVSVKRVTHCCMNLKVDGDIEHMYACFGGSGNSDTVRTGLERSVVRSRVQFQGQPVEFVFEFLEFVL